MLGEGHRGVEERGFRVPEGIVLEGDGGNGMVLRRWVLVRVKEQQESEGTLWRRGVGFRVPEGTMMPRGDPGAVGRPHGVEVWGFGVPEGMVVFRGVPVSGSKVLGCVRERWCPERSLWHRGAGFGALWR